MHWVQTQTLGPDAMGLDLDTEPTEETPDPTEVKQGIRGFVSPIPQIEWTGAWNRGLVYCRQMWHWPESLTLVAFLEKLSLSRPGFLSPVSDLLGFLIILGKVILIKLFN